MSDKEPLSEELVTPRRALISVSDKSGLLDLARALAAHGIELVSTGGTANALKAAGFTVKDVANLTGYPEMMDGRVKTLHPAVHGGLLALRENAEHQKELQTHKIEPIDLVVVNLYPFEETIARQASYDEAIENIDIGGPAMIRAAAKNHSHVCIVTDAQDYTALVEELHTYTGATRLEFRKNLAQIAYARTAAYDACVSNWMAAQLDQKTPRRRVFAATHVANLRYGENPHQDAAFYRDDSKGPSLARATQHQGKALSYNNINDADAALEIIRAFDPTQAPACAIIKHANPCGVAQADDLATAYQKAFDCDRTSAFGGIIALNQALDGPTARQITQIFTELVIAPSVSDEAREIFAAKKNLRLLTVADMAQSMTPSLSWRQVTGGMLLQDKDIALLSREDVRQVSKRAPSAEELNDLLFAWNVAKYVKSNAIVFAKDRATVGIGAGQMSRVDSTRIAARKAQDMCEILSLSHSCAIGAVVASDAFFPFPDGIEALAEAGARAIIQPGGALRDDDVIAAADAADMAMVFTGQRHFRH